MIKHIRKKFSSSEWANHQFSPAYLRVVAFISFALVALLIYSVVESNESFPEYKELVFDEGRIHELKKDKYGIDFSLDKSGYAYRYYSKGGAMDKVWSALKTGAIAEVGHADDNRTVYTLSVDGKEVRSYADIRDAYDADNGLVKWMAPAFFLSGCFLFHMAYVTEKYRDMEEVNKQRREAGFDT